MAQSSILGRVGQLVRANINALLDSAEDPERMLDQMVRDYTDSIREAEEAVAQTIGNLRLQEDDAKEAGEAADGVGPEGVRRLEEGRRDADRRQLGRRRPLRRAREDRPQAPDRVRGAGQDLRTRRSSSRPRSSSSSRAAST